MSTIDASPLPYAVAIVESDPRARTRLALLLGESIGEARTHASIDDLADSVPEGTPCLVILGPSHSDQFGLLQVERLTRSRREIGVVLVVDQLSTDTLQAALRAGVRDVVAGGDAAQLFEALTRVGETLSRMPRAPAAAPPVIEAVTGELGKVITIFSTKGGAGKSVLACNLALTLARRSDRPVVLVDADLQFGDVAVMLKLAPTHTIVDAVANLHRLDLPYLQSLLIRHSSGLLVLAAPIEPAFADQVSPANLLQVIDMLKTFCGHVVIDTRPMFDEMMLEVLEKSDDILLIAGLDLPNIKNVKLGLQTLRMLNLPMGKIHLVLNRANSKVHMDVAEVERTLQMKAAAQIPSDIVVPQSVNKGVPAVISAPKSGVARSIEQLSMMFIAPDQPKKRR